MTDTKVILNNGQISDFIARLITKPIIVSLIIISYSMVTIYKHGMNNSNLIILGGAIFTIFGVVGHVILFTLELYRGPEWPKRGVASWILATILNLGGFIPYLYGIYIILVKGFWGGVSTT